MLKTIIFSSLLLASSTLFADTQEKLEVIYSDDNTVTFSTATIPDGALVRVTCAVSIHKNRDENYLYILAKNSYFSKIGWDNVDATLPFYESGSKIRLGSNTSYLNGKDTFYITVLGVGNINEALIFDLSHAPAVHKKIDCSF
ncbi:MAG: hypothetical protein NXI01_04795 [Gammaproteobacteria bacterium]|nr:hypothetical protein [Gammaproteobacteria bacterium]